MQNLRKEARFPYAGTKNLLLFLWSTLVYLSMKYRVNGIEIPLDRKETAAAKRMVAKFMEEVEKNSKDTGNTSLYFTTLILMQVLSQEAFHFIFFSFNVFFKRFIRMLCLFFCFHTNFFLFIIRQFNIFCNIYLTESARHF